MAGRVRGKWRVEYVASGESICQGEPWRVEYGASGGGEGGSGGEAEAGEEAVGVGGEGQHADAHV